MGTWWLWAVPCGGPGGLPTQEHVVDPDPAHHTRIDHGPAQRIGGHPWGEPLPARSRPPQARSPQIGRPVSLEGRRWAYQLPRGAVSCTGRRTTLGSRWALFDAAHGLLIASQGAIRHWPLHELEARSVPITHR